jgi:hypothetical protein
LSDPSADAVPIIKLTLMAFYKIVVPFYKLALYENVGAFDNA